MSPRLAVLTAVKTMLGAAVPQAELVGLDGDEAAPARLPETGRIVVRSGSAGDPEVDLSPLRYNWVHRIPVEVAFPGGYMSVAEVQLDAALAAVGAAIEADRFLGGLCEWLDATLPETENVFAEGARPPRAAEIIITAHYSTTSPLG